MAGARAADPHAVEERHDRGRPPGEPAEHPAVAILDRLRAIEPARGEMFHQSEEERQVVGSDPLLIERQDEIAAIGVQQEVRVLDAFGNALVRQQLAELVAGEAGSQILGRDVRVDGHAAYPAAAPLRSGRGSGKNTSSLAAETVSKLML